MPEETEITSLPCEIITPNGSLFAGEIMHLESESQAGEIELMPRHEPIMAVLGVGQVRLVTEAGTDVYAVHGGFLEMDGNRVTILADEAEHADSIDLERAEKAQARAKERLAEVTTRGAGASINISRAKLALLRSISRIRVKQEPQVPRS